MGIPWSFKRNFTGAKEIKDTNDYLSKIGRAIGSLDSMPVGFNMSWWSDTLPSSKYMFMEGQSLANYPEARAMFGDYLPDLRDCTLVHKGSTPFDVVGNRVGEKAHTLTADEMQHTNSIDDHFTDTYSAANGRMFTLGGTVATNTHPSGNIAAVTASAHNNIQPSIVCRYIAKVLP